MGIKSSNIRFNPLKHHLEFIRQFVKSPPNHWKDDLLLLGHLSFDVYTGKLTIIEIEEMILHFLKDHEVTSPSSYLQFIGDTNNYKLISLIDGSCWVIRWGTDPFQFIHLHTARIGKCSIRVRSSALKTAITMAILMQDNIHPDVISINQIRKSLELPVINNKGMDKIINLFEIIKTTD